MGNVSTTLVSKTPAKVSESVERVLAPSLPATTFNVPKGKPAAMDSAKVTYLASKIRIVPVAVCASMMSAKIQDAIPSKFQDSLNVD